MAVDVPIIISICFNSRTREGCDSASSVSSRVAHCFNSRTREGCDYFCCYRCLYGGWVSIHAPGRGATKSLQVAIPLSNGFNSRTREGCDIFTFVSNFASTLFQFTHPGGVRPCSAPSLRA